MVVRLDRQHKRLVDLLVSAMADLDTGRSVWRRVVVELGESLRAPLAGVFDVSWPAGTTRVLTVSPGGEGIDATAEENRAYPLIRHFGIHRDPGPRTLGEVADECRWRTSPRYAAMREQFAGAPQHLMIPLRTTADGVMRLVGLGRPGRDFDAHERLFARRVQHVLIPLDRHVETVSRWRQSSRRTAAEPLTDNRITPRELAVLALLADGLTPGEIGRRLGIAPRTATKHQENLQRKLRTRDRINTVLRAQQLGLV
jgi:DNA-binding CsgD family transcriptional regulator